MTAPISFNPKAQMMEMTETNAEQMKDFLGATEYSPSKDGKTYTFKGEKDSEPRVQWPAKIEVGQYAINFMGNVGIYTATEANKLMLG